LPTEHLFNGKDGKFKKFLNMEKFIKRKFIKIGDVPE